MAPLESGLEAAEIDLAVTPLRELNATLHAVDPSSTEHYRVLNPRGAHALAVGLDAPLEVEIEGHAGYYCAGMNKEATGAIADFRKAKAEPRNYSLLDELYTKHRMTNLAKVRNPNPDLEGGA